MTSLLWATTWPSTTAFMTESPAPQRFPAWPILKN
jgi:hypothetical protein